MSTAEANAWVALAHILSPQGRRGEVQAQLLTSFPEKFAERSRLFLMDGLDDPHPLEVQLEEYRFPPGRKAGRVVLKFAGVDSIEAAELYVGLDVSIPRNERAATEEDEYYLSDLEGCRVWDGTRDVGIVEAVDVSSTSVPLLVVRAVDGEELLLPLAKAFLVHADTAAKTIRMKLPDGLLEINRAEKQA